MRWSTPFPPMVPTWWPKRCSMRAWTCMACCWMWCMTPDPPRSCAHGGNVAASRSAERRCYCIRRWPKCWDCIPELEAADAVVNTIPAHGADVVAQALLDAGVDVHGMLLDVVYDPRPTALMRAWRERGGVAIGGEEMLLYQAVAQVLLRGRARYAARCGL